MWISQCLCVLWPDAVLICNSNAGVEGMEFYNRWHARVSVNEYLVIQAGNTCNWMEKWKREEFQETGKSQAWFLLECPTLPSWSWEPFLPFWGWNVPGQQLYILLPGNGQSHTPKIITISCLLLLYINHYLPRGHIIRSSTGSQIYGSISKKRLQCSSQRTSF